MNAHKKLLLRKTLPPIPTLGLFVYFLGLGLHFFIFGSFLLTFIIKPRLILCFALRSEVDSFARSPMFYFKNCIRRWPPGKNTHIAFSRFPFHFLSEENNFAFFWGGGRQRRKEEKRDAYMMERAIGTEDVPICCRPHENPIEGGGEKQNGAEEIGSKLESTAHTTWPSLIYPPTIAMASATEINRP